MAIIGSADAEREYESPILEVGLVGAACRELGRELARDYDILMFTPDPRFVELDVLNGFLQPGPDGSGVRRRVVVSAPRDVAAQVVLPTDEFTTLVRRPDPAGHWSVGFYRALLDADAVLLLGGERTTRIAGTIALAQRKPVLIVAAFGGAALEVWGYLTASPNDANEEDIATMGGPWTAGAAKKLVGTLASQLRQRAERERSEARAAARRTIRAGRIIAALTLLAAIALLPVAAFAVDLTSWKAVVVACGAAMGAAVAGGLVTATRSESPRLGQAALEGFAAGMLASFVYVVSQIASTPDFPTAAFTAPRLMFFLIPIGFLAGFSFRTVLSRAAQAQTVDFSLLRTGGDDAG